MICEKVWPALKSLSSFSPDGNWGFMVADRRNTTDHQCTRSECYLTLSQWVMMLEVPGLNPDRATTSFSLFPNWNTFLLFTTSALVFNGCHQAEHVTDNEEWSLLDLWVSDELLCWRSPVCILSHQKMLSSFLYTFYPKPHSVFHLLGVSRVVELGYTYTLEDALTVIKNEFFMYVITHMHG